MANIKNVYSEPWKSCYADLKVSTKATETTGMACSTDFIAAPWEAGGGGVLGVIHIKDCNRNPILLKLKGHTQSIQAVDFSPFYSTIVASASDDTTLRVWDVPAELSASTEQRDSVAVLKGHAKKVMFAEWNPVADFVLASASFDATVKLWDVNDGSSVQSIKLQDSPTAMSWNYSGGLLATVTKGKQLHTFDPRSPSEILSVECHEGSKSTKLTWIDGYAGAPCNILTTGFSKSQARELKIWDGRKSIEPVSVLELDRTSQPLYPVFDEAIGMLFVAGKGDGNLRFYHYSQGSLHKVGEYRSDVPIKAFTFTPKLAVDSTRCEIDRLLKCEGGKSILPVSIIVPRKNPSAHQADLYPPVPRNEPALLREEWLAGENKEIKRIPHLDALSEVKATEAPMTSKLKRASTKVAESRAVLRKKTIKHNAILEKTGDELQEALDKIAMLEKENETLKHENTDLRRGSTASVQTQELETLRQALASRGSIDSVTVDELKEDNRKLRKELKELKNFYSEVAAFSLD